MNKMPCAGSELQRCRFLSRSQSLQIFYCPYMLSPNTFLLCFRQSKITFPVYFICMQTRFPSVHNSTITSDSITYCISQYQTAFCFDRSFLSRFFQIPKSPLFRAYSSMRLRFFLLRTNLPV